ncbi:ABC-type spermidine/putrescine transport system, permease component I [Desulforapulum autotrophicum HRM2]|uniref:ABC-type spermidine/putrescine transport system, permease component I n=1 Tax=Desulforapulum autotrophicum (strain ATCC 43914 / DSM 3382 / VKM B-1955 / HRM2) TaxID=177437 RepID=C0Q962_DESAH|nr:ABC transporter permease [Desulforapulum autotrophicum]ACN16567.1 ABC-type spermidine/putrescine transport system, permease component I [Desulforapulum autotrophicum HRM2]
MNNKNWKPWALLSPSLSAVFLLLVVPVCFVVVYSFWLRAPNGSDIPAFQMGNYAKFFADTFYPSLLLRTIRVALETVFICLAMGYVPAYFFYRTESRFKPVLMILIMLPFWISFIIRTLSWINILGDSGLINHLLMKVGIISSPLSMLYNEGAVLMGLLQYLLPFMILNIYVSLDGIDKSLTEAATSLGCTEWQAFREVTLPLSLPGVSAGCLLVFVLTCGTYLPPMILGGPGNEMIANLIFKRIIGTLDWPFGSAISTILLGLLGVIVYTYNRYLGINQIFKSLR